MAKKDLATINLTQDEAKKFSAKRIEEDLVPRLSNRRSKFFLVDQIESGAIQVPAALVGPWTYKTVAVKGVEVDKMPGRKEPVRTITKDAFAKMDAKAVAKLIEKHTTEKRAAYVVQALLTGGVVKPTARDLVYLSNGRIAVHGITIESTRKGIDLTSLVAGVTIGKPAAKEAAA